MAAAATHASERNRIVKPPRAMFSKRAILSQSPKQSQNINSSNDFG
jgi:hypothetical protein